MGAGFYGRTTRDALLDPTLSDRLARCLGVMGTYADKSGYTFVGERTLAADLGVERRTIRGYLDQLRDTGRIVQIKGGHGQRHRYFIPGLTKQESGRAALHDVNHSQTQSGRAEAPEWAGSPSQGEPEQVFQPEHDVDGRARHPDRPWQIVATSEEREAQVKAFERFRKAAIRDGIPGTAEIIDFKVGEVELKWEVGPPELKWEVGQPEAVPYVEEDNDDPIIWVEAWDGEQHAVIPPLEAVGAA